jgi:hypothetical protein
MPFHEQGWGRVLPGKEIPRDSDFEEQASKLNLALRSCHAVVSSYRSLLSGDRASDGGPATENSASESDPGQRD